MKKNVCLTCIENVKKYNIGNAMCYFGILISLAGAATAFVGNRIRINTYHSKYIVGPDALTACFDKVINNLKAKKP